MVQLSVEAKKAIVQQTLNRGSDTTIETIARANNVGLSSLQKWLRRYREGQSLSRVMRRNSQQQGMSNTERFEHLVATHYLDELSLGEYCRKHGLYNHQLITWREELMATKKTNQDAERFAQIRRLKEDNKHLQQELRRKDKALAEASALLILKKKAALIWGASEAD